MKIFLKFVTIFSSMASPLSDNVCHTRGNGTGMRWTIGTPSVGQEGENNREQKQIVIEIMQ